MSQERGKLAYRDDHLASMDSAKTIVKHWRASMRQQKRSVTTTFPHAGGGRGREKKSGLLKADGFRSPPLREKKAHSFGPLSTKSVAALGAGPQQSAVEVGALGSVCVLLQYTQ